MSTIRRLEFEACGPEDITGKFPEGAAFMLRGTLGVHSTVLRSPFVREAEGCDPVISTWVKDLVPDLGGTRQVYYAVFPEGADIESRWTYVNTISLSGDDYHVCQSAT